MKYDTYRIPTLLLLGLLLGVSAGFIPLEDSVPEANSSQAPVTLPIEVIGADAYTTSVIVDVADASSVDRLWMEAHRPGYKYGEGNKGSVRINGGPWIDINNQTATCQEPEASYECIGGAYATVRFTLPVANVTSGSNTIEFRFNGSEGISIGWRVLKFNFLRFNGTEVLPPSAFVYDDYDAWQPPRPSQSDINAGKALYETAPLVEHDGAQINARCADCHAANGRDLKYFNYSNHSIIERSKFHGLSQQEGEQIASYIRSLSYVNPGTPWDPPYQPGPDQDSRPEEEWSAGAGLEWVLDSDEEMLPYLFPDGVSWERVSTESTINIRDIPLSIQFPDWNEWLPRVHPKDVWGNTFENHPVNTIYNSDIPNVLSGGTQAAVADGSILNVIENWGSKVRDFRHDHANENAIGGWGSDGTKPDWTLGFQQWHAVKMWEVMTTYKLESAAPQIYEHGESRSWLGKIRTVFDIAPHIIGPNQAGMYPHGNGLQNYYFSHAWYQLQLNLNASNRTTGGFRPVDWKYHFGHHMGNGKNSGNRDPLRYILSYVRLLQMADNDIGVGGNGWYVRHITPGWLLKNHNSLKDPFSQMDPALRSSIFDAVLRSWTRKTLRHNLSEWERGSGENALEPANYIPGTECKSTVYDDKNLANHLYCSIPVFAGLGVAPSLLDSMVTWAEQAWPQGGWDTVRASIPSNPPSPPQNSAPSVGFNSPSHGSAFTAPADIVLEAWASDSDGTVSKVEFYAGNTLLGEDTTTPYSFTWASVGEGSYSITAKAIDNEGGASSTQALSISVNEEGGSNGGNSGVNALPTIVITSPANGEAFSLGEEIVLQATATDSDGNVTKVKFFKGGSQLLKKVSAAPFTYSWSGAATGSHTLTAKAFDDDNASATSVAVTISVTANSSVPDTQDISLLEGWNFVSAHVAPENAALESVFADILDNIVIVKDEAGQTFIPEFGINTIGNWNPMEAYMVYAESNVSFSVEGSFVSPEVANIALSEQWNLVPYLRQDPMSVDEALTSIASSVVIVKDFAGLVYIPEFGINTIGDLQPGQAYKVYVDQPVSLTYPANGAGSSATSTSQPLLQGRVGEGMSSSSVLILEAPQSYEGREVFARLKGNEEPLASATVKGGKAILTIPGDDPLTQHHVEGAQPGEELVLEWTNPVSSTVEAISVDEVEDAFSGRIFSGSLRYEQDGFQFAKAGEVPTAFTLAQNYPNPFNPATTIEYGLASDDHVKLEVYNTLGQRVAVMVNEAQTAGTHRVQFSAHELASGIYVYRLQAGSFSEQKTMLLMK